MAGEDATGSIAEKGSAGLNERVNNVTRNVEEHGGRAEIQDAENYHHEATLS